MNDDATWMRLALAEARLGLGTTSPNPSVGAVIVRDGEVLGRGYTRPPGGPHAEIEALRAARANGHDPAGATMFVTLEPCCHHGRTPPCTDAILAAGIGRVVVGVVDPFPAMRGKSLDLLREAGVEVRLGVEARSAGELILGFSRVQAGGLPEVSLKAAVSLDGCIATEAGESKWITGEAARGHGHKLRGTHDAILTGVGTVLADDPALTNRSGAGGQPRPVVLDSTLRIPAGAQVLQHPAGAVVCCAEDAPQRALDAEIVRVPRGPGGVDVVAALRAVARLGMHRVLVEGGGEVHRSMLEAGLADHLYLYVAPTVIPGGRRWVAGPPLRRLRDAPALGAPKVVQLGDDVLLHYRLSGGGQPDALVAKGAR